MLGIDDVTENELLLAIQKAFETGGSDYLPASDIGAALDWSTDKTRAALRILIDGGLVEVGRLYKISISGVRTRVPGYRLRQP